MALTNDARSPWGGQVVVIGDDPARAEEARATLAEIAVPARLFIGMGGDLGDTLDTIWGAANPVATLVQLSPENTAPTPELRRLVKHAADRDLPVVVQCALSQLDELMASVAGNDVEFLLDDDPANLLFTLNDRIARRRGRTLAENDDIDIVDLRKISADVDRIAQALVRLSGPDRTAADRGAAAWDRRMMPDMPSPSDASTATGEGLVKDRTTVRPAVAEGPVTFRAENPGGVQPFGRAAPSEPAARNAPAISADRVRATIRARRLREHYFDAALFADPAWDMLLDLMAASLEDRRVSVSSLCIAANVPPTTALRWIKAMTDQGIFVRRADETDGRRVFIELSDEAAAGMIGYFAMLRRDDPGGAVA